MKVVKLADGLWRWTAPHPAWVETESWEREVGCVYYEPAAADAPGVVLIDPLVPPEGSDDAAKFWRALDGDVARRGRGVAIVVTNAYHGRSSALLRERYDAAIHAPDGAQGRLAFEADRYFLEGDALPGGLEAIAIEGLDDPDIALFIRPHRALVFADGLLGAPGGGVRLAPITWAVKTEEGAARYRALYRPSVARLVDLDPVMLLVSHGEPVLAGGREALLSALRDHDAGGG